MNTRAFIARHRKNSILHLSAVACEKFLRAYNNQFNWDIEHNGEAFFIRSVLRAAPGVVFDVGGNAGSYASACLTVEGCRHIHVFEISPPMHSVLREALGAEKRVTLNEFGLGADEREVEILHAPDAPNRSSAYSINDGFRRVPLKARIRRGDEYMANAAVPCVSLLKIDVEGMDFEVLRGFSEAIDDGAVKCIQFEHGYPSIESRTFFRDIYDYLTEKGMVVFKLFPNTLVPIRSYSYALEDYQGRNYVATTAEISMALGRLISPE